MKRTMTWGQANACETAALPRCRCRCGGALHGAGRTEDPGSLPEGDPHYVDAEKDPGSQGDLFAEAES